jgi:hypothetical protein
MTRARGGHKKEINCIFMQILSIIFFEDDNLDYPNELTDLFQ